MQRAWLLFSQTVTIALALYCVVAALRPDWLARPVPAARPAAVGAQVALLQAPPAEAVASYRAAAARALPAVVNILTTQALGPRHPFLSDPRLRQFFGAQPEQHSLGSGVIVSADGYILTNNHVIEAADQIEVVLADGRKGPATVVGTDPETDLAVIRIRLDRLPVMVLGRDEDTRVGDVVLAVGNPFGVGQTVTMGIISAVGRNNLHLNAFENFIQTDAAINFGNSGGALIDTAGNLIGINSAIYSQGGGSVGIGFAIPVSTARTVLEAIVASGQVVRGWIGVESQDITPEMADSFDLARSSGAIVAGVVRQGPAERAGMLPGDILLAIGGKPVDSTSTMLRLVAELRPGAKATITVLRKRRELRLSLTVAQRPRAR